MEWYAIFLILVLIGGLGGLIVIGANTDKFASFNFGKPSQISTDIQTEPTSSVDSVQPPSVQNQQVCNNFEQKLINIRVQKAQYSGNYDHYEYQQLLREERKLMDNLHEFCGWPLN